MIWYDSCGHFGDLLRKWVTRSNQQKHTLRIHCLHLEMCLLDAWRRCNQQSATIILEMCLLDAWRMLICVFHFCWLGQSLEPCIEEFHGFSCSVWTGSLVAYSTGGPGHWTADSLLHQVQPIKWHQTLGNGLPGPINKVEAYTWKYVCLMHDAGATNKVQPESWKYVCLMHDACSFPFSNFGWLGQSLEPYTMCEEFHGFSCTMWTGSLVAYSTGGPGHWTTDSLLHRVQAIL